ncbi:MAG: hypothetical protein HC835_00755 [Oscillatoriales cyanobacterium RM2_1_1]|nr:hypothetical protein [Oscillatoriales cyanobacterium SM2_3_0]NJO44275.1 hypothetical protein [Oscillatoriales cyanobacterium RM2_1_1]
MLIPTILLQVTHSTAHPVYSVCASSLVIGIMGLTWRAFREGWTHLKRLHRVPCSRCAYFTGDYRLKCTVHPSLALTEDAIGCHDFEQASHPTTPSCSNYIVHCKFSEKSIRGVF